MSRRSTRQRALSIGQLAQRWCIGPDRVRRLIEAGHLPGAFTIPSAGRYGEAVKIPWASILQAEKGWEIAPSADTAEQRKPPRQRDGLRLKHLSAGGTTRARDVGCHAGDQH